jgi:hypothetical protein
VPHGDRNAVALLQRFDPEAVFQRLRDRLFGVHVFARLCHLLGERKMLLIRHCQYHAFDFGILKHRFEVLDGRDAQLLLESLTLVFAAAVACGDLQTVGLRGGAGKDFGPAAQADDADFDGGAHRNAPRCAVTAGK